MAIYNGNQKVSPSGVQSVYVGSQKVYEKSSGGSETWILNESPISYTTSLKTTINFTSNGENFVIFSTQGIDLRPVRSYLRYYTDSSTYIDIVSVSASKEITWTNEAYRTIIFETPPTGTLLNYLQSYAVKQ